MRVGWRPALPRPPATDQHGIESVPPITFVRCSRDIMLIGVVTTFSSFRSPELSQSI